MVMPPPPRGRGLRAALAGIRAHNRWLKDFCAEDPVRRAGIGVILPNDLDEAVKEIEFIAEGGPARRRAAAADRRRTATWLKPLYDPAWDRVYAAIQDHDLVMNQHTGAGIAGLRRRPGGQALWMSEVTLYCQTGFRHLLLSGVYEKFPKLQVHPHRERLRLGRRLLKALDRIHMGIVARRDRRDEVRRHASGC